MAIDTRGARPRLLMASRHWHSGPQVLHSDDLGVTWASRPTAPSRFPEDTGTPLEAVWQSRPAPDRARRRVRRHRAVRAVPLHRPGRDVRAGPRRSGTTRTGRSGAPASAARRSTRCCRTPPTRRRCTVAMSTGASTGPTTAASLGAANQGIRVDFLPEDPVPGVRPVRAQGGAAHAGAPTGSTPRTTAASTAPTTTAARGTRSPTGCPATSASRSWPTRTSRHRLGLPARGRRRRASRPRACRVWRSTDAGATWERARRRAARRGSTPAVMRDAMCVDDATRPASTSAAATAASSRSHDEGDAGSGGRAPPRRALRARGDDLTPTPAASCCAGRRLGRDRCEPGPVRLKLRRSRDRPRTMRTESHTSVHADAP